ncbi:MAG: PQQ-binding-like beta-propeller repeat protein [Pirellulaceae bacterium]|nr:PQQ-binding-like beta-propeller repeat protein [Pirellulaceae bacterium]
MRKLLVVSIFALVAGVSFPLPAQSTAADWPHWRGAGRNDLTAAHSGWRDGKWRIEKAWSKSVGEGCSSPIVYQGKVYALGWSRDKDTLICLDLTTGKTRWEKSYPAPKYGRHSVGDKSIYSGSTSTPELDPSTGRIYTLSVDGQLQCWDINKRGELVWSFNLYDRYGAPQRPEVAERRKTQRDYGYTSSPVVFRNWLLVEVGAKAGNLIAFDKTTGREVWKNGSTDEAGHTGGPALMEVEGKPCAAVLTLRNLVVTRLDEGSAGEVIGEFRWTTDFANNIASPAVFENEIVVTSAYNHVAMAKVRATLKGLEKVWETPGIASGVCSPIVHRGKIYWAWRGVHCVDWRTGKEVWAGGKVGSAGSCALTSDNRLVVWADRGNLLLVDTAERAKSFQQVAAQQSVLNKDAWPHVVVVDGHILCKDRFGALVCFSKD